jgi:membrane dipeptidase
MQPKFPRFARTLALAIPLLSLPVLPPLAWAQTPAPAAAAPTSDVREHVQPAERAAILAALDHLGQAVIHKDRHALEEIYADDLSYGHTTGEVLDKAKTVERNLDPNSHYSSIDVTDVAVRDYGSYALVTHKIAFHLIKDSGPQVADLGGLDIWIKKSDGWQLLARQLTKLPPSATAQAIPTYTAAPELLEKAAALQKSIVTFDNHLDVPFDYGTGALEATTDGASQFDLPKAARGEVKGASIAIFVPQGPRTAAGTADARKKAQQKYDIITHIALDHPDRAAIAYTPAELKKIEASGRFAIVLSILNANAIGDDLTQFDAWYQKGVRIIGFNHAGNNDLSDSSRPNILRGEKLDEHGGLSDLGKQAVQRLNDLGVLIDVSQLSQSAFNQVLQLTRAPVVASHSNARAIIDHPRNLTDAQLEAIRKNGGVVAINAYSSWVRPLPPEAQQKANEIRKQYGVPTEANLAASQPLTEAGVKVLPPEQYAAYSEEIHKIILAPEYRATVTQYVDQLDYVIKKIGIDHVGISSDFNHGGGVIGWDNEGEALNVTAELLHRGYTRADIAKLWGGNFLRVWAKAQSLAKH